VWSVVERVINKSRHPNVMSLRTAIEAAFADIDSVTLQCERFRLRIEAVIETDGDYIELYSVGTHYMICKRIFCNIQFFR